MTIRVIKYNSYLEYQVNSIKELSEIKNIISDKFYQTIADKLIN